MRPTAARDGKWAASEIPDQAGRSAVVTGASSGLGLETARMLAERGATVVLACRSLAKAKWVAQRIRERARPADVRIVRLDLTSLASVRDAAEAILAAS